MRLGELLRKLRWPATSWRHATHRAAEPPSRFWDQLDQRPGDDDQWERWKHQAQADAAEEGRHG